MLLSVTKDFNSVIKEDEVPDTMNYGTMLGILNLVLREGKPHSFIESMRINAN